ncbi:TRAP transporter substrate-binding protein [Frigidibacter sp. MR17.14]|uniref:TRAP transporter substrate-binding protein n=1 Tax=Frigidibacter sp. MR17.14 TaxID=3126509 RepID=UPI003012F724
MNPSKTFCLALLLSATALAGPVSAEGIRMVLSNDNNEKGLKGQTFEKFIEEAKSRLGDDLTTEMHHSGTLFDQQTQIQGLQLGEVQVISPTIGIYTSLVPEMNVFELPFLLDTPDKIVAAMEDPEIRAIFVPKLEKKGIEPIAVWMNGPRDLGYRGSKAVVAPADVKGMKIRVQSAPVYVQTFEVLGANAVGINWSEAPTALEQGVIDGAEVTPNSWHGSGTWQMIDQITLTDHQYSAYVVGANKAWWDGLSDDARGKLQEALDVATQWNIEQAEKINADDIAFIEGQGKTINRLTPEQRAAWSSAMEPVWKTQGYDLVGDEIMAKLKAIAGVK